FKDSDHKDWEPSEADKLNVLEWVGMCSFNCGPFRVYENGKWSEWYDGVLVRRLGDIGFVPMRKVKGQWEINDGKLPPFRPIPCEQIPKSS
ncbi:MAG TPA: hypothetical protein VLR90_02505, partial [Blastocatellia bacterium]|nr:hypothetical protein [Blastocatellia bacterium]